MPPRVLPHFTELGWTSQPKVWKSGGCFWAGLGDWISESICSSSDYTQEKFWGALIWRTLEKPSGAIRSQWFEHWFVPPCRCGSSSSLGWHCCGNCAGAEVAKCHWGRCDSSREWDTSGGISSGQREGLGWVCRASLGWWEPLAEFLIWLTASSQGPAPFIWTNVAQLTPPCTHSAPGRAAAQTLPILSHCLELPNSPTPEKSSQQ